MGAGRVPTRRRHSSCAVAACCMLCLLCHHGARCTEQHLVSSKDKPLADSVSSSSSFYSWADENNELIVQMLLNTYGNGQVVSHDGFEMLLTDLKIIKSPKIGDHQQKLVAANSSSQNDKNTRKKVCEGISTARRHKQSFSSRQVLDVCPALLVQLVWPTSCSESDFHNHVHLDQTHEEVNTKQVWLYATGSIVIISACGLLAVAVIPIMQKMFYQQLLQFLVSLAVGSLCGDALLHLLPHALSADHGPSLEHGDSHADAHDHTNVVIWRGFVAMLGVIFFFFTEKCLTIIGEWKRRTQRKKKQQVPAKVRVMRDVELQGSSSVGEKLCKHKYSAYPYCYEEITGANAEGGEKKSVDPAAEPPSEPIAGSSPVVPEPPPIAKDLKGEEPSSVPGSEGYTVIVREHARAHHGHSHSHGHVHSAPHTLSAVAWMVVMGDGLHNFTDGLAIGAAFAAGIPGGLSTALAVFCHELPHELGDFAVLLKAGMSAKQAVCYNLLSSGLCFIGMIIGVNVGHSESAAQWVFAAAAGMFLYIALVDMIPELTNGHSAVADGVSCAQTLLLQLSGMVTGVGIMLLIALHESSLRTIFCEPASDLEAHTPCNMH